MSEEELDEYYDVRYYIYISYTNIQVCVIDSPFATQTHCIPCMDVHLYPLWLSKLSSDQLIAHRLLDELGLHKPYHMDNTLLWWSAGWIKKY